MRKIIFYLVAVILMAGFVSSCRKNVLPPQVVTPPPPPPPPPPEPEPEPEPEPDFVETEPPVQTGVSVTINSMVKGYYQSLPARYNDSNNTKKYPVIVFFHGGGQYGNGTTDLPEILTEGIPKLIDQGKFPPYFAVDSDTFSFIVISPQFVKAPTNSDIDLLIKHINTNFRVDTTRLYLVGFSLGARFASDYAASKPEKFAALTSMGGLPNINDLLHAKCEAMTDARLPIWHFHNMDDEAWPYAEASRYVEVLNSFKPVNSPRFTSFEVGEARLQHDCWTRGTNPEYREDGKNIYEWMLQYKR